MKKNELNDLFIELKQEYLESFDEKIESIMNFWFRRDLKNLKNEFHKIRGTGTTYGVHEASAIAEILEDLCDDDSPKLGLSIMIFVEMLRHIRFQHERKSTLDLDSQKCFVALKRYHKEGA